uniref:SAP domain-containing protein n=1 Tax=Corethron hystrix TaxID=216773 RepID=A0A6U5M1Z5_9STRA|mmetsp:Transcript_7518/g.16289  ORF Transcript_7518/g.16289 Transcript_7518/m.16289 type:complete len:387 (+) Transcript_7518:299-1459(+)
MHRVSSLAVNSEIFETSRLSNLPIGAAARTLWTDVSSSALDTAVLHSSSPPSAIAVAPPGIQLPPFKDVTVNKLKEYCRLINTKVGGNKFVLYERLLMNQDLLAAVDFSAITPPPEPITNSISIEEHRSNSFSRASSVEVLIETLKGSAEYTSALKHSPFNTDEVMVKYLSTDIWIFVRSELLNHIASISYLSMMKASNSVISSRAKIYNTKCISVMHTVISSMPTPAALDCIGRFKIEWKSTLCTLYFSFVSSLHHSLCNGSMGDIISNAIRKIDDGGDSSFIPSNASPITTALYYLAGYFLYAADKESERRGVQEMLNDLENFVCSSQCLDSEYAVLECLLTSKVDRLNAYGGLKYANANFFVIVCYLEEIFKEIYTSVNLVIW